MGAGLYAKGHCQTAFRPATGGKIVRFSYSRLLRANEFFSKQNRRCPHHTKQGNARDAKAFVKKSYYIKNRDISDLTPVFLTEEFMSMKSICLAFTVLFFLTSIGVGQDRFSQYRRVEAYEVRPGILMMPRFTASGELCEVGFERLQYSTGIIRLEANLSREEIAQTLDQVVPSSERGNPLRDMDDLIALSGLSMTTTTEYENVSVSIFGRQSPSAKKGQNRVAEVVATIRWKKRTCRP